MVLLKSPVQAAGVGPHARKISNLPIGGVVRAKSPCRNRPSASTTIQRVEDPVAAMESRRGVADHAAQAG